MTIHSQFMNGLFVLKKPNSKVSTFLGRYNDEGCVWAKKVFAYAESIDLLSQGYNIALKLSSLSVVCVDIDNDAAYEQAIKNGIPRTYTERTKRGLHFWYLIPDNIPHFKQHADKTTGLELKCCSDSNSSLNTILAPSTVDDFTYEVLYSDELSEAPKWVLQKIKYQQQFRPLQKQSTENVNELLANITAYDDYDTFIKVGMVLHNVYEGSQEGLDLWTDWSSQSGKYEEWVCKRKYEGFGSYTGNKLGIGSLFKLSKGEEL